MKKTKLLINFICLTFLSNTFLFQPNLGYAQNCDCTEMIYVNEAPGGNIHKYTVNADGTLTEIGAPWSSIPPQDVSDNNPSPHGLGIDLNGNIYIGESANANEDIRKFTCEGQIFPESEFQITTTGQFNIHTIGNSMYVNQRDVNTSEYITRYDLCTGAVTGSVSMCEWFDNGLDNNNRYDWGFYIDPVTNEMYATSDFFTDPNRPNFFWYFTDADFDSDPNTCVSAVNLSDEFAMPGSAVDIRGVVTDADGNVYIAILDDPNLPNGGSYILKYGPAPTFNYIGASAVDDTEDGIGYRRLIGLVYSATTNLIYSSNESAIDDCVSIFDTDLNYLGAAVPPVSFDGNPAKGIGLTVECCPIEAVDNVNELLCVDEFPVSIFLNEAYPCGISGRGAICEGVWEVVTQTADQTFNDCSQEVEFSASGCITVSKVSDGDPAGGNINQCGAFNITFELCVDVPPPPPAISITNNTCNPDVDGSINVITDCSAGTLEWSTDGGATWVTTAPAYDNNSTRRMLPASKLYTPIWRVYY